MKKNCPKTAAPLVDVSTPSAASRSCCQERPGGRLGVKWGALASLLTVLDPTVALGPIDLGHHLGAGQIFQDEGPLKSLCLGPVLGRPHELLELRVRHGELVDGKGPDPRPSRRAVAVWAVERLSRLLLLPEELAQRRRLCHYAPASFSSIPSFLQCRALCVKWHLEMAARSSASPSSSSAIVEP